jgi:D-alanine-D-alanine ligase
MIKVAVISGGYSGESIISARSAAMVMANIDRGRFDPVQIYIDRQEWVALSDGERVQIDRNDFSWIQGGQKQRCDIAFIMIHGSPGEDGLLQGYLQMQGIPFTTGDVLSMALTFDKAATKAVLAHHGFRTAPYVLVPRNDVYSVSGIIDRLGLPCFVKPNRGGSSFGATKVKRAEDLQQAIEKALGEDGQALVETFLPATELTCGVIPFRGEPRSLPLTEIVSHKEFFDFEAKYQGASEEITPARIEPGMYSDIQRQAERIYRLLNCKGMIRVDFLISNGMAYMMEVNAVPGFSEQSIIPQQAGVEGISKKELISMLIESALV